MSGNVSVSDIQRMVSGLDPARKNEIAAQIGQIMRRSGLDKAELRLALEMIDQLIADSMVSVRKAIAGHIAESPLLPRTMIERLLADVAEVALPVVRLSSLMDDTLLLEQIERGESFQVAVAERAKVSAVVSERLISKGTARAVETLVSNTGADIRDPALSQVIDRFGGSAMVMGAVARRPGLPIALAEKLVSLTVSAECVQAVSMILMETLTERHDLPRVLSDDLHLHGLERALAATVKESDSTEEVTELARRMREQGRLTTSLMLRVYAGGDIAFFIAGMSELSGWSRSRTRGAIQGAGMDGFRRLYSESGLDGMMFHAFRVAREEIVEAQRRQQPVEEPAFVQRVVHRISQEYANIAPAGLEDVLARLVRRPVPAGREIRTPS